MEKKKAPSRDIVGHNKQHNSGRAGSPVSAGDLTVEQALRRAMSVPAPASDPAPPKKRPAKKKAKFHEKP